MIRRIFSSFSKCSKCWHLFWCNCLYLLQTAFYVVLRNNWIRGFNHSQNSNDTQFDDTRAWNCAYSANNARKIMAQCQRGPHRIYACWPGIRTRSNRKPYRIPCNTLLTLNDGILLRHSAISNRSEQRVKGGDQFLKLCPKGNNTTLKEKKKQIYIDFGGCIR